MDKMKLISLKAGVSIGPERIPPRPIPDLKTGVLCGGIKVVRIIARLNIGGPAINASILSSALDRTHFQTMVICGSLASGEGGLEHMIRDAGIRMEQIPELGREINPWDDIVAFFKIARILLRERPDIVHTHTAKAGTLGRLAAFFCGVNVRIHTFHGNVFRHYFSTFTTKVFVIIERILGRLTTKVIAISPRQYNELVNEFRIVPAGKCVVIPLGMDSARLACNLREKSRGLKEELGIAGTILVGIIGRLVPIKNHRMFIAAARRARDIRPDLPIRYAVIGDGELREELKKNAFSLGVNDIIYFLGWRNDLGVIYSSLDIVALTSLNEGTPLTLIEAMASGKAVVATDVGGVTDLVDNGVNGIIVPSGDSERFVQGIIALAEDPDLRRRLGEAGRAKSVLFSKENLVRSVENLYRDSLSIRRKRR